MTGVKFPGRAIMGNFLFATASRPALGPIQPLSNGYCGAVILAVKRPGREADHSPPSSAEVKHKWSNTSVPPILLHGMALY